MAQVLSNVFLGCRVQCAQPQEISYGQSMADNEEKKGSAMDSQWQIMMTKKNQLWTVNCTDNEDQKGAGTHDAVR